MDRARVFSYVDARILKLKPIDYYEEFKTEMQAIFNKLAERQGMANLEMETFDE